MSINISLHCFPLLLYYFFRKRVFILGPSHNVRLSGCALSTASKYCTPFYDLTIDTQGLQFTLYDIISYFDALNSKTVCHIYIFPDAECF